MDSSNEPDTAAVDEVERLRREVERLRQHLAEALAQPPIVQEVPAVDLATVDRLTDLAVTLTSVVAGLRAGLAEVRRVRATPLEQADHTGPPSTAGLAGNAIRILETAARHYPMPLTRAQLATLSRIRVTGSTFAQSVQELRRRGLLVDRDTLIEVTAAGLTAVGRAAGDAPMTRSQMRAQWLAVFNGGARDMLAFLLDQHPESVTRAALAAHAGIEATGTFTNYLGSLRRNGLIEEPDRDRVRAASIFFALGDDDE